MPEDENIGRSLNGALDVQVQETQLYPTLIIALGGSGKEVALRLRKRFFEKYGVTGFPTVGYLWVDTDMQNTGIDNQPLGDYVSQECLFKPGELIDATIPGQVYRRFFSQPGNFPHISSWIDLTLAAHGQVQNGAGAIRQLGRLGFFHAYPRVRTLLTSIKSSITSQSALDQTLKLFGFPVNPSQFNINVIFSVAGGTGSGMFLDMAFLLRELFKSSHPDITGYLILPAIFSTEANDQVSNKRFANGYAALMELEYYSMRKDMLYSDASAPASLQPFSAHDFQVTWQNNGPEHTIMGPPFNTCYLIGHRTQGGGHLEPEEKKDLCDMLAESLFLDFHASAFANLKRSVRVNLEEYLRGELRHTYNDAAGDPILSEIFSRRFSSLGLSFIGVPIDRIRKACAYHLGSVLADHVMKVNSPPGDLPLIMKNNIVPELALDEADFQRELRLLDETGRTFFDDIRSAWLTNIHGKITDKIKGKGRDLAQAIEAEEKSFSRAKLTQQTDFTTPGEYVLRLHRVNYLKTLNSRKKKITDLASFWLQSHTVRGPAAIIFLMELSSFLAEQAKIFTTKATAAADEARVRYDQDYSHFLTMLQTEESMQLYHRWSLREISRTLLEHLIYYFEARIQAEIYACTARICLELQELIADLSGRVQTLIGHFRFLNDRCQKKFQSFDRQVPHRIFEETYTIGMYQEFFLMRQVDGNLVPVDPGEMEARLAQRLQTEDYFKWLQLISDEGGLESFSLKVYEEFCYQQFRDLQINADAVNRFFQKYPDPVNRSQRLKDIVNKSLVWLKPGSAAQTHPDIGDHCVDFVPIGISSQGLATTQYRNLIHDVNEFLIAAHLNGNVGQTTDVEPEAVYIYSERAAIPMPYLDMLEEYRQAYRKLRRENQPLHLDRQDQRFADICIKDDQEVRAILNAKRTLLIGSILGIIRVETSQDGSLQYAYLQPKDPTNPIYPLGNTYLAMGALMGGTYCQRIWQEVNQKIVDLNPEQRKQFLTILLYHTRQQSEIVPLDPALPIVKIQEGPFAVRYIIVGDRQIPVESYEYQVINQVLIAEQHAHSISKEQLQDTLSEYYPKLDTFSRKIKDGDQTLRVFKDNILS